MIYFDNAATSLYKPDSVVRAVNHAMKYLTANPGRSGHILSNNAAEIVYETRELLKQFFNATEHEVVFTKNCTEALNLAILGTIQKGDHVICTKYEHNSVLRPLRSFGDDIEWTIIDDDMAGIPERLEKVIKSNTRLVITSHVSNVTGEMCDIYEVGSICRKHGIRYLVDGAQSSGHLEVEIDKANIDMFAFAGHKGLMSITGVGGLLVKKGIRLSPILYGGTGTDSESLLQPDMIPEGFEAGTIPTIPIASLKAGVEFLMKNFSEIIKKEEKITKYAYFSLKKLPFIEIYSKDNSKNVISFNVDNIDCNQVANILNEDYSICVRSGLHCAPKVHESIDGMRGCVRVSVDFKNTEREVDYLCDALIKIYHDYA